MDEKKFQDEMKEKLDAYTVENFKNGLNCTESIYEAFLRTGILKMPKETLAMCVGFGAGIGISGNVCGALTAAILINSAVYGRPDPWAIPKEERAKEVAGKHYRRYNHIYHRFREDYGSVMCKELCEMHGGWASKERRLNCLKIIRESAILTYEFLLIPQEEGFALPYKENMGDLK